MHNKLTDAHINHLKALASNSEQGDNLSKFTNNYRPVDGRAGGNAELVLLPNSTEEVSAILKYCNDNKLKLFTQGGNSGLVGGSTPDDSDDGIVLSLINMNKILSPITDNISSIKAQAGVVIDQLNTKLLNHDLFCSIKHGGTGSATAGGNASTNSGGENAIKYGVTRDQIIGLTVALPNGEVLKLGGNIKDTANNIMHLFIGSEGAYGVITEVEFKVYHLPENLETVLVTFDDLNNIQPFLSKLKKEFGRDGIESFEFMNNFVFNETRKHTSGAEALGIADDKKAYVLFEVSSPSKSGDLKERLIDFLDKNNKHIDFENSLPAFDTTQRKLLWHIREHCTDASRKIAGENAVRFDTCVPLDKIAESLEVTEQKLKKEFGDNFIFIAFGHWGDGNIHLHIIQDKDSVKEKGAIVLNNKTKIEDMVLNYQVTELGGTASAEHGFGRLLNKYKYYPKAQQQLIKTLKNNFDPNNILNPGIAVPK